MNARTTAEAVDRKPLIVIANLGRVRGLKHELKGDDPQEKEHLVECFDFVLRETGSRIRETVTDQSGRFGKHGSEGFMQGMACGEEHQLEEEIERKVVARVVEKIAESLKGKGYPRWWLVAPATVLHRLEEGLPDDCLRKLSSTIAGDFTKWPIAMLEERFLK